jgi:hypothetical protein
MGPIRFTARQGFVNVGNATIYVSLWHKWQEQVTRSDFERWVTYNLNKRKIHLSRVPEKKKKTAE